MWAWEWKEERIQQAEGTFLRIIKKNLNNIKKFVKIFLFVCLSSSPLRCHPQNFHFTPCFQTELNSPLPTQSFYLSIFLIVLKSSCNWLHACLPHQLRHYQRVKKLYTLPLNSRITAIISLHLLNVYFEPGTVLSSLHTSIANNPCYGLRAIISTVLQTCNEQQGGEDACSEFLAFVLSCSVMPDSLQPHGLACHTPMSMRLQKSGMASS